MISKKEALKSLEDLPDESTVEDMIDHLYFLWRVEQGLADADAGRKVSDAEARERLRHWLS